MTINFQDGSAGLFDVLGKLFYAMETITSAAGTTVRTELEDIVTQHENVSPDDLDLNAIIADAANVADTFDSSAVSALVSLRQIARDYLIEVVDDDNPLTAKTFLSALAELRTQMIAESDSFDASAVAVSAAAVGTLSGNGVLVATAARGDGLTQQTAYAETITVESAFDGSTAFTVIGEPSVDLLALNWPGGSGAATTLNAVAPSSSLVSSGGFDALSTLDSNVPSGWIASIAQPGVTVKMTTPEQQTIAIAGSPTAGYYLLHWANADGKTQTTEPISFDATASTVQSRLRSLAGLESVTVTSTGTSPNVTHTVTFLGAGGDVGTISSTNRMSGGSRTNEVQTITLSNTDGGTFTLTYSGQTTSAIAYNASAATTQAALEALSNIEVGDVSCSGGPFPAAVTVTFTGALAAANIALMTIDTASLTNTAPAVTAVTATAGSPSQNEIQTVTLYGSPSGGTFTMKLGAVTSSAIAYNANAAAVESALEAMANINDVTVTGGPLPGTPVVIEFQGALAATSVDALLVDTSLLTGGSIYMTISTIADGASGGDFALAGRTALTLNRLNISEYTSFPICLRWKPDGTRFFLIDSGANGLPVKAFDCNIAWSITSSVDAGDEIWTAPKDAATSCFAFSSDGTKMYTLGNNYDTIFRWSLSTAWSPSTATYDSGHDLYVGGVASDGRFDITNDDLKFFVLGLDGSYENTVYQFTMTTAGDPATGSYDGVSLNIDSQIPYATQQISICSDDLTFYVSSTDSASTFSYVMSTAGDLSTAAYNDSLDFAGVLTGVLLGSVASEDGSRLYVVDNGATNSTNYLRAYSGSVSAVEEQQITATGSPSQGTFTLTYSGQETGAIDFNATAAVVQAALLDLSNMPDSGVVCTGGPLPGTPVTCTFSGSLGDVDLMLINDDLIQYSNTETQSGNPSTDEVQTVTLTGSATGGTFTLSHSSQTTSAIAYNANAATVEAALDALGIANFSVTGSAGGPWSVTFGGALAATDVALLTGDASSATNADPSGLIVETTAGSYGVGSISHAETVAGTPQVYSGTYALIFESDGSELTQLDTKITVAGETAYALNLWLTVAATAGSGVIQFSLVDGISGTVINDSQGNANTLTVNVSDLTTGWQSLDELVSGEPVFRLPAVVPSLVYLRMRFSTAPPSGTKVFFDHMAMQAMTSLYSGGPLAALFAGSDAYRVGDTYAITVTNDRAGKLHEWMARTFDLAINQILLPVDAGGSETIPDSVVY